MTEKKEKASDESTYLQAFNEFLNEFRTESDRAAVILGAARLDLSLYHLLQHTLLPNTSRNDELLEGDSPLSTFSARINICYRLGLIHAEVTRSLHLIRKIRNVFAHETSGSSLNSGSHRDRVRELSTPFLRSKTFVEYRDKFFGGFEGASRDFRAIAAMLVLRLDGDYPTSNLLPQRIMLHYSLLLMRILKRLLVKIQKVLNRNLSLILKVNRRTSMRRLRGSVAA